MKYFTSYYANYNNIPKNYMCIGISRVCPEWFARNDLPNFMFVKDNYLAPSQELLSDIKENKIDVEEYKKRYITELFTRIEQLSGYKNVEAWFKAIDQHFSNTYTKWEGIVFMCYETPNNFCHRHLVRRLLNNIYHIDCSEFGVSEEHTWGYTNKNKAEAIKLF